MRELNIGDIVRHAYRRALSGVVIGKQASKALATGERTVRYWVKWDGEAESEDPTPDHHIAQATESAAQETPLSQSELDSVRLDEPVTLGGWYAGALPDGSAARVEVAWRDGFPVFIRGYKEQE